MCIRDRGKDTDILDACFAGDPFRKRIAQLEVTQFQIANVSQPEIAGLLIIDMASIAVDDHRVLPRQVLAVRVVDVGQVPGLSLIHI